MTRPVSLKRQLECLWEYAEDGGGGGGAGVSSFNARTGVVTLGSGDVTGALGFTPQAAGSYALADHDHDGLYALVAHSHPIAGVTGLQAALDGKQASGNYAAVSHSHAIADVTGLQTALDGKQASGSYSLTSHNHDGVYVAAAHAGSGGTAHANVVAAGAAGFMTGADKTKLDGVATGATANSTDAQLRDRSTHTGTQAAGTITGLATVATSGSAADLTGNLAVARLNSGSGASGSTYWRGDGTWGTPSGGADPWTYVRTTADFTTSSATAVDIVPGSGPALTFTPAASKKYEFEARLRLRTATATVGPRPGLAWPTGFTDGTAEVRCPSAAGTEVMQFGNPNAAILGPVGGLPNATQSWPGYVGGEIEMGGSPSGTVKLQLASETAGTNVTCKAGSWLRYREIP